MGIGRETSPSGDNLFLCVLGLIGIDGVWSLGWLAPDEGSIPSSSTRGIGVQ